MPGRCDSCGTFVSTSGECSNPRCGPPEPRFEIERYARIRYWDGERERYYYVHRLVAYAHGVIDDPFAPVHIHHENEFKLGNSPSNLSAEPPDVHGSITARSNHENGRW